MGFLDWMNQIDGRIAEHRQSGDFGRRLPDPGPGVLSRAWKGLEQAVDGRIAEHRQSGNFGGGRRAGPGPVGLQGPAPAAPAVRLASAPGGGGGIG
jgi:hypothetical protein